MDTPAVILMQRLGLTDDELCEVLDADPLTVIADDLAHRPEIQILLTLTTEAQEHASPAVLRRWVRVGPPGQRPIDHLLGGDFAAFEDALADLAERGFVIRSQ